MFGGVPWVLAIVLIWLLLFVATLTFARYSAREHDQESVLTLVSEPAREKIPAEPTR